MGVLKNQFFKKMRDEPPIAAAIFTITVFTIPVIIGILINGVILLPHGYTSTYTVQPIYGFITLLINLILLLIFSFSPVLNAHFHSIIATDFLRKILMLVYILITFSCIYIINVKLNFFTSLIADPIVTMLTVGNDLVEENVLRYYFFGISGCIAFALIEPQDGFFLKAASFITVIIIVLFYFFLGRREISIMTLCFLFLMRAKKVSKMYLLLMGGIILVIIIYILTLRTNNDNGFLFATDSEELSSVAYSSYVVQKTSPDFIGSFTLATVLRPYLTPLSIEAAFVKADSGYSDTATPVLGIAGVTYMYGFIIPMLSVLFIGSFFRTITNEFKKKKTPILKLLLIYITFKSFNLFRNGEFPIVIIDVFKFFLLMSPALFLKFNKKTDSLLAQNHQTDYNE